MQEGQATGLSAEDMLLRAKRALVHATADYLFKCPNYGGLTFTNSFVLFPVHRCHGLQADAESEADSASRGSGSKRRMESLDEAEPQQKAPTPKKKSLLTRVSVTTQVSVLVGFDLAAHLVFTRFPPPLGFSPVPFRAGSIHTFHGLFRASRLAESYAVSPLFIFQL